MLWMLLVACFTPPAPDIEVDVIPFSNDYTDVDDIVLRPFRYPGLTCPDGEPASFYMVYREGLTTPAPVAVVFHSDALDYVTAPVDGDPLGGEHYAGASRLTAEWSALQVFETLGIIEGDGSNVEVHLGILPAILANRGVVAFYPTNCWGDLWHNEDGYTRNAEADGFTRNGRFMAYAVSGLAWPGQDDATLLGIREDIGLQAIMDTLPLETDGLYYIGFGEGGRAPMELIKRQSETGVAIPPIKGIGVDSTIDDMQSVLADAGNVSFNTAVRRVYDGLTDAQIGAYSYGNVFTASHPAYPVSVVWSTSDPEVPRSTLQTLLSFDDEAQHADTADNVTILQVTATGHVFSNRQTDIGIQFYESLFPTNN